MLLAQVLAQGLRMKFGRARWNKVASRIRVECLRSCRKKVGSFGPELLSR